MSDKRIVVLISGNGSNLQALIDAQQRNLLGGKIVAVVSNTPLAYGLVRASQANIPTHALDHKRYGSRALFDDQLAALVDSLKPDLVVLAGFMRILSAEFVDAFYPKLINIHPSLLPKYPGLNTHQQVIDNQDSKHGTSIHFVTGELDGGPLIAQSVIEVDKSLNAAQLGTAVQQLEHQLYPLVIIAILKGRIVLHADGIYFDDNKVDNPLSINKLRLNHAK